MARRQSLRIGFKHLDTFASIGAFSGGGGKNLDTLIPDPEGARKLRFLWISCGDKDGAMKGSEAVHASLEAKNIPHIWHIDAGGHTWPVWRNDLYLVSQRLFRDEK